MAFQSVTTWQAEDCEVDVRYGLFATAAEAATMGRDGIQGLHVDALGLWVDLRDGTRAPVRDGSFVVRRLRDESRTATSHRAVSIDDFEVVLMSTEAMRNEPAMHSFGLQSYGVIDGSGQAVALVKPAHPKP